MAENHPAGSGPGVRLRVFLEGSEVTRVVKSGLVGGGGRRFDSDPAYRTLGVPGGERLGAGLSRDA